MAGEPNFGRIEDSIEPEPLPARVPTERSRPSTNEERSSVPSSHWLTVHLRGRPQTGTEQNSGEVGVAFSSLDCVLEKHRDGGRAHSPDPWGNGTGNPFDFL